MNRFRHALVILQESTKLSLLHTFTEKRHTIIIKLYGIVTEEEYSVALNRIEGLHDWHPRTADSVE